MFLVVRVFPCNKKDISTGKKAKALGKPWNPPPVIFKGKNIISIQMISKITLCTYLSEQEVHQPHLVVVDNLLAGEHSPPVVVHNPLAEEDNPLVEKDSPLVVA